MDADSDSEDEWALPPTLPDQAIHRAARAGDLDGLRRELDAGVNPDLMCDGSGSVPRRPLTILCDSLYGYRGPEENRVRGVRMLIEAGASLNVDSLGFVPLQLAAARGNLELVQMLLEAGADVKETREFGWTALHSSVGADSPSDWFHGAEGARRVRSAVDCAAALIAAGADVNAATRTFRTTPLTIVACVLLHFSHLSTPLYAVLLRGGATLDRDKIERRQGWTPYLDRVHDAGGWKRYAWAHRTRLVATFAPKLRLPADVIPLVVDFWANVGMY